MCAHAHFCILSFVHLFDGLVATTASPVVLVGAVPGVFLVDLAPAEYLFCWHAHWPGGELAARVSELDPGDSDMMRTTEASLAWFRPLRDT